MVLTKTNVQSGQYPGEWFAKIDQLLQRGRGCYGITILLLLSSILIVLTILIFIL